MIDRDVNSGMKPTLQMDARRSGSLWRLSVVIPVYNSALSLATLVERLQPILEQYCDGYEIILVNDGSRDNSWVEIIRLCERFSFVWGIDMMRNYGQHNAVLCGIRAANYDVIVTMDDDLQNPPEEIHRLLDKLSEGYDVVYGTPEKEQHGLWRDLASQVTKLVLQSAVGAETARKVSPFRAFRSHIRAAFATYQSSFVSIDVLLTWGTTRFTAVTVRHDPRRLSASNYTLRKLSVHALNMMTGFSTLPLQVASLIGVAFSLFGLIVLLYVIGRYLIQGSIVPGFPFLASLIALFSGAQLFALGIIGEYLARMHFRTLEKPPYVVRSVTRTEIYEHQTFGTGTDL